MPCLMPRRMPPAIAAPTPTTAPAIGIDPSASTIPDTMSSPTASPADLPTPDFPRPAISFSACPVSALTGIVAFAFCRSLSSVRTSRRRFCASRICSSTSGVALSCRSSPSSFVTAVSRRCASSMARSIFGLALMSATALRSLVSPSTFLPVLSTSDARSRIPFWAPVTTASKMARTVRSATRSPLPRGLLQPRIEHDAVQHPVVISAFTLRRSDGRRAVAPGRGHHVSVLVVRVLTFSLRPATRRTDTRLGLSRRHVQRERPRTVVLVEGVPLRHGQPEVTRRPSLRSRGRVVMQAARY